MLPRDGILLLPMSRLPLALAAALGLAPSVRAGAVAWQPWSNAAFEEARSGHKFVIMDLEAVWCHWCHVMDETTYRDPKVIALLGRSYVALRVDQDSRPDLSNKYEDYGWPATIVFAADGSEIVRRRGYINPAQMASMLQAIIDDPSPGPSVTSLRRGDGAAASAPADASSAELARRLVSGYDRAVGGWGAEHRFLDADNVEWCLRAASRGDAEAAAIARDMLRLEGQLADPTWGGVYQYSAGGDWVHPHFEKIMSVQADNLRTYSLAAQLWPSWSYGAPAGAIAGYLRRFLRSPDGAFYTSQDADLVPGEHAGAYFALDDAGRRAKGIPRVDTHRYARENGWAIAALCALHDATGSRDALAEALGAAAWVGASRSLPGGGFRHDEGDAAGPYLGDTLSMGRAFLALYLSTGDAQWLEKAGAAAGFIQAHFARAGESGFATSDTTGGSLPTPGPEFDEAIGLARFANLLAHASGRASYRAMAQSSLRWAMSAGQVARRGAYTGGLLLAGEELRLEPIHVTVVGRRADPDAAALFAAALRAPSSYRLTEWWDRSAGPAPRGEDIFPELPRAAAYLCANGACSSPITDKAALEGRLSRVVASAGEE
ncbi:MAG TPA: DUF255 domain-containing protein [Opitutaceae bacterium]|jgi:hypothetical protein